MEFTNAYTAVALSAVVGKLVYKSASFWWNAKSLKEKYIIAASSLQLEHEAIRQSIAGDDETEFEKSLVEEPSKAHRKKGLFRNYLVQQGQAKFGCPIRNEANRLVVRKYLLDICLDHGILARHVSENLDVATELVFVPSRDHLLALAVAHTDLSVTRLKVSHDLGGPQASLA